MADWVRDSIYNATTVCIQKFEEYLRSENVVNRDLAVNFQGRLLLWASCSDAISPEGPLLDEYLKDDSDFRKCFVNILDLIRISLEEGNPPGACPFVRFCANTHRFKCVPRSSKTKRLKYPETWVGKRRMHHSEFAGRRTRVAHGKTSTKSFMIYSMRQPRRKGHRY